MATATIIIRSDGPIASEASHSPASPVSIASQQQQSLPQPATEQRQLLHTGSLPSASTIIFNGIGNALSSLAKRSRNSFEITLAIKSDSSVALGIHGKIPPIPLPGEFRTFEVPGFRGEKTTHLLLRPAMHPKGQPCLEFDVGAFLFSHGYGLEDSEPNWYAIKRNVSHEDLMAWFEGWLL